MSNKSIKKNSKIIKNNPMLADILRLYKYIKAKIRKYIIK